MQATCTRCGTPHALNDAQIGDHPRVQFRCSKCREVNIVEVARRPDRTQVITPLPSFARGEGAGGLDSSFASESQGLALPAGREIALTVVSGPLQGEPPYRFRTPRVVLGRGGADYEVNDPEVSRAHCVLEVKGDIVRLQDLESTNGTYFNGERVRAAELASGAEFRIGSTVFRLTIAPR